MILFSPERNHLQPLRTSSLFLRTKSATLQRLLHTQRLHQLRRQPLGMVISVQSRIWCLGLRGRWRGRLIAAMSTSGIPQGLQREVCVGLAGPSSLPSAVEVVNTMLHEVDSDLAYSR